jgi:hypothetical protein
MKEWCLAHPYLAFFLALSLLSTLSTLMGKILELFVKKTPPVINMNIDPASLNRAVAIDQNNDDLIH